MNTSNIRKNIAHILYDILFNNKLSHLTIDIDCINESDKSLARKEVNGVLENKILLEHIIDKYSKVKSHKLDRYIYIILLLGVYEILFLSKIPSFATINSYVDLVKQNKLSRLSGYVNAVLRSVDRNENIDAILLDDDIPLRIKYSMPDDVLYHYDKNNVNVVDAIKKYNYVRVNSTDSIIINKILKELNNNNISYKKYNESLVFDNFIVLSIDNIKDLLNTNVYKAGLLYIQDVSSIYLIEKIYQYIDKEVNLKKFNILDMCSSPGGKIIGLLHLLGNGVNALANDISKEKIDKIKENAKKEGIECLNYSVNDATCLNKNHIDKYNLLICDVPCSGLGVISKKPDIKYNFSNEKIDSLVNVQRKIIDNSKLYVKKNGILSYSTCTITAEEDEENIKWFLENNKNFELLYEEKILQNNDTKADGFYIAILKRNE